MLFASEAASSVVRCSNILVLSHSADRRIPRQWNKSRLQRDVTNPLTRFNWEVSRPALVGNRQPTRQLGHQAHFREGKQYGQIHNEIAIVAHLHCVVFLEAHVTVVRRVRARL